MPPRAAIPKEIKRQVRDKCGFGCIICGDPEYDFHHIIGHAAGGADSVENLVLLCPNHHQAYHRGTIPISIIERFSAKPFAKTHAPEKYLFLDMTGYIPVVVGNIGFGIDSAKIPKSFSPIRIGDSYAPFTIQALEDGIYLDAEIRGTSGAICLRIDRNKLSYTNDMFDFFFQGPRCFRERLRRGIPTGEAV